MLNRLMLVFTAMVVYAQGLWAGERRMMESRVPADR